MLLGFLLAISITLNTINYIPIPEPAIEEAPVVEYVVTDGISNENAEILWTFLRRYSVNETQAAGALGLFYREGQFTSNSLGWHHHRSAIAGYDIREPFIETVDAGLTDGSSLEYFIEYAQTTGGFGLGQWYTDRYLTELYLYAQEWGTSIADAEMQCAYTIWSMNKNERLTAMLRDHPDNPSLFGWNVAVLYDGASEAGECISGMSLYYYNMFKEG